MLFYPDRVRKPLAEVSCTMTGRDTLPLCVLSGHAFRSCRLTSQPWITIGREVD